MSIAAPMFAWILAALMSLAAIPGFGAQPPLTAAPLAALPGLQNAFAGTPNPGGIEAGALSPCPESPNCVVSQNADSEHGIAPIPYQGSRAQARATLQDVLSVVPRTKTVEQTDDYIYAESASRLLGFVDDLEFYLPADEPVIHMRSASRMGESDLGVNRRRLQQIRLALQDLGL